MILKSLATKLCGVSALVLGAAVLAAPAGAATMDFSFRNVNPDVENRNPNFDFAGGLWYSNEDTVFTDHNLTPTNPDISAGDPLASFSDTGSFTFAGQWGFTVTGSSGDDWDDVLAATSNVLANASWDGQLIANESGEATDVKEIHFSNIFGDGSAFGASLGTWVENNNNGATPGGTLPEVWTYLDLSSVDPLTGGTGEFGVVAYDPDDIMGLDQFFLVNETDLAYVGTEGSGSLSATHVPEPATLGLIGVGLAGIGIARRRKRS